MNEACDRYSKRRHARIKKDETFNKYQNITWNERAKKYDVSIMLRILFLVVPRQYRVNLLVTNTGMKNNEKKLGKTILILMQM